MASREPLAPEEFYHVYNRGVDKRKIFLDRQDRERFLALLYLANQHTPADLKCQGSSFSKIKEYKQEEPFVSIVAYCLMPNHFHILLREREEKGTAQFMQKLSTGYTVYFNKKNKRNGALFQGTYKSQHVDNDRYFKYLVSYIHLNPIKLFERNWKDTGIRDRAGAEEYLGNFKYSSFPDYLGVARQSGVLLNKTLLQEVFSTPGSFKHCVTEWLGYKNEAGAA